MHLQWTTMGPVLPAVLGLSSTSATRRSRGAADSGVWWSGQAEKRMCFTCRHSCWHWSGHRCEIWIRVWLPLGLQLLPWFRAGEANFPASHAPALTPHSQRWRPSSWEREGALCRSWFCPQQVHDQSLNLTLFTWKVDVWVHG